MTTMEGELEDIQNWEEWLVMRNNFWCLMAESGAVVFIFIIASMVVKFL